jgi:hypothetical protein
MIQLDHNEVKLRILLSLYLKRYGGQLGHPQATMKIIQESGLEHFDQNLVHGDIVYLKNGDYVKGMDILGQAYPYTLNITNKAIDLVNDVINSFLDFLEQLGNKESKTDRQQIESTAGHTAKLYEIQRIINNNPDRFRKFLKEYSSHYGELWPH